MHIDGIIVAVWLASRRPLSQESRSIARHHVGKDLAPSMDNESKPVANAEVLALRRETPW
jgi:hypothetical protein